MKTHQHTLPQVCVAGLMGKNWDSPCNAVVSVPETVTVVGCDTRKRTLMAELHPRLPLPVLQPGRPAHATASLCTRVEKEYVRMSGDAMTSTSASPLAGFWEDDAGATRMANGNA